MAYIGAESPSDWLLHDIRKGTRADQTLEVVEQMSQPTASSRSCPSCWRRPQDPEGETERTFEFIRLIKRMHPATEIMIYIYTPLPPSHDRRARARAALSDAAARLSRADRSLSRHGG